MALYTIATAHAWQIKEWLREPISLWAFVVMGIAASVGGIIRGHLVFTDVMNRPHLVGELQRTKRVRLWSDVVMAALLTIDALACRVDVAADDGADDLPGGRNSHCRGSDGASHDGRPARRRS